MNELKDLKLKLQERENDLNLAAKVGQSLLVEIDRLKLQLHECSTPVKHSLQSSSFKDSPPSDADNSPITPQIPRFQAHFPKQKLLDSPSPLDASTNDLSTGIQNSLLEKTRELSFSLSNSEKQKIQLSEKLADLKSNYKSLKKQNELFSSREAKINETLWNLEVSLQESNDLNSHLHLDLSKSRSTVKVLEKERANLLSQIEDLKENEQGLFEMICDLENKLESFKSSVQIVPLISEIKSKPSSQYFKDKVLEEASLFSNPSTEFTQEITQEITFENDGDNISHSLLMSLNQLQEKFNQVSELKDNLQNENSDILKVNAKYLQTIENLKGASKIACYSQTNGICTDSLQISENSNILLLQNNDFIDDKFIICRNKAIQNPSIMTNTIEQVELILKKKYLFDSKDIGTSHENFRSPEVEEESSNINVSFQEDEEHAAPPEVNNNIEALTYTMIGSWFQKYNRNNKNPKLRYFWINPYSRTLNWSENPPSRGGRTNTRSVQIEAVTWNENESDYLDNFKNYPPTKVDSIEIQSCTRIVRITPLNWTDRALWISGISVLLKKTPGKTLQEEFAGGLMSDNQSTHESVTSSWSNNSSPKKRLHTPKAPRTRSMTVVALEATPVTARRTSFWRD